MEYKALLQFPVSYDLQAEIEKKYEVGYEGPTRFYDKEAMMLLFGWELINEVGKDIGFTSMYGYFEKDGKAKSGLTDYGLSRLMAAHRKLFKEEVELPELESIKALNINSERDHVKSPLGAKKTRKIMIGQDQKGAARMSWTCSEEIKEDWAVEKRKRTNQPEELPNRVMIKLNDLDIEDIENISEEYHQTKDAITRTIGARKYSIGDHILNLLHYHALDLDDQFYD